MITIAVLGLEVTYMLEGKKIIEKGHNLDELKSRLRISVAEMLKLNGDSDLIGVSFVKQQKLENFHHVVVIIDGVKNGTRQRARRNALLTEQLCRDIVEFTGLSPMVCTKVVARIGDAGSEGSTEMFRCK